MDGVINVLKPPGMTSHDVVDFVRRTLGVKRAGHTGTLDPGAAGVLPVCVGKATRVSEYLLGSDKAYRAVMVLGVVTDTHDAQGRVEAVHDPSGVTRADVERALGGFRGVIRQVPPMISAGKHAGERLYRLARRGVVVERAPRTVTVMALELVSFQPGPAARAILDIACSKGTYVRTLCHDIGQVLGCGAYLDFLVRTRHGPFVQEEAVTIEELEQAARDGTVARYVLAPGAALAFLPEVTLRPDESRRLALGIAPAPRPLAVLPPEVVAGGRPAGRLVRLSTADGALAALARLYPARGEGGLMGFRLEKVLL